MRITVATRRSALALAQSRAVAASLEAHGHEVSLLEMTTTGDRWSLAGAPDQPGADVKGMFVKELEEALLDGRADIAVHSAKDLPGDLPHGLAVLATPPREDPGDVLVGEPGGLAALAPGARAGGTHPCTGRQRGEASRLTHQHVARVFAGRRGQHGEPVGQVARQVLCRMHGDVGAPIEERLFQLLHEHALYVGTGLVGCAGQAPPVARGRHLEQ